MGRREVGLLCLWLCCSTSTGCQDGYYWYMDGYSYVYSCRPCSMKTPRCTQCVQKGGLCTKCSGRFLAPSCTDCKYGYYTSASTCVQCSSNCKGSQCHPVSGRCTQGCKDGYYGIGFYCVQCSSHCKSGQCDPASGRCTEVCRDGYYRYNGKWSHTSSCLPCSEKTPRCTQCVQNGGLCTKCSGHLLPPSCTDTLQEEKEEKASFFKGPVFGGFLGFALIMALICTAIFCWRRKSSRNAGNPSATEMSSSAPALNLSNPAIQRPNPPPPASSTAGVSANVYIIGNDNHRTNGRLWPSDPPPYSCAVGNVHETVENENHRTNGRLSPSVPPPYSCAVGNVHETVENDNHKTNGDLWQAAPPPYSSVVGVGGATSMQAFQPLFSSAVDV